jgi:hypothetical protein
MAATAASHYDVVSRTFAALPQESTAYLRILTVRAGSADEATLVGTLRPSNPGSWTSGSSPPTWVGGRWATVRWKPSTSRSGRTERRCARRRKGVLEQPLFASELAPWRAATRVEMYDAIEIAPRLPRASGPPLVILDEDRRIVDITATAAAGARRAAGRPDRAALGRPCARRRRRSRRDLVADARDRWGNGRVGLVRAVDRGL